LFKKNIHFLIVYIKFKAMRNTQSFIKNIKNKERIRPMNRKIRENGNAGFSLVELIVVIAIMAVMVAVLAPSLLQYVERSRAQKDDSAMGEVTNAIQLALSDQDIYDEVLYYTSYNNVSCYIDQAKESELKTTGDDATVEKIVTKKADTTKNADAVDEYMFDDNARLKDEVEYHLAGNMRGVTITFNATRGNNKATFKLADAWVNDAFITTPNVKKAEGVAANWKSVSGLEQPTAAVKFSDMKAGGNNNTYLYNRVRATIGDSVELTSQTYRNSDYTVFIRMGSTGGNQATAQDAIKVYGQWNGTNLVVAAN
jgi:type IV pilus assembly protein PilA